MPVILLYLLCSHLLPHKAIRLSTVVQVYFHDHAFTVPAWAWPKARAWILSSPSPTYSSAFILDTDEFQEALVIEGDIP